MEASAEDMRLANGIEKMADMLGNSLFEAQCAVWALTSVHEVSKQNPSVDRDLPLYAQIIWRALFDRLYIKIGTAIEKSDKAANLQNLKKLALQKLADDRQARDLVDSVLITQEKWEILRNWRNKIIAHNDPIVDAMQLYTEQKMHISEYQPIITELYRVLNTISVLAIGKLYKLPQWQDLYPFGLPVARPALHRA